MSRSGGRFLWDRDIFATVAYLAVILAVPPGAFTWGREGHQVIVIVAGHYMRPETAARTRELLALLFLGRRVQSEILRAVYPERAERDSSSANKNGGLRMTAKDSE